jgi:hypothetical protein
MKQDATGIADADDIDRTGDGPACPADSLESRLLEMLAAADRLRTQAAMMAAESQATDARRRRRRRQAAG